MSAAANGRQSLAFRCMVEVMNCLLTHGLRSPRTRGDDVWVELVTRAIQEDWPAPAASQSTLKAERGLGILGKPYYFYVLWAESIYGFVVFVFSETKGVVWPHGARGATPFDSGGWWHGNVRTQPSVDKSARQAAFRTLDVPLRDWQGTFEQYVHTKYGTVDDYLKGHAPSGGHPMETSFAIIKGKPNEARAWIWEVRVPYELITGRLALKKIFMAHNSRSDYVDLLPRNPLVSDRESARIYKWIHSDHVKVTNPGESVVRAVRTWLAQEITHD